MAKVGELFVVLGLDPAKYQQGIDKAEKKTVQFEQVLEKLKTGLTKFKGLVFGAIGTAATGAGLFALTSEAAEAGEKVYQLAIKLNLTTKEAGELGRILSLSDVETQAFVSSITRLDKSVLSAGKNGNLATNMLKALGVSLTDANGKLLPVNEQLEQLSIAYKRASAVGVEEDFAASVLGPRGMELIPLLRDYAEAKEVASKVKSIGLDPKQAHEQYIALKALKMQTGQLGRSFAVALMPLAQQIIPLLMAGLAKLATVFKEHKGAISLAVTFGVLIFAAAQLIIMISATVTAIKTLEVATIAARAITILKNAFNALSLAMARNPWVALVTVAVGALIYLISKTETASKWLAALQKQMSQLFGLNFEPIPTPQENENPANLAEDYNKYAAALENVGNTAAGAGKKVEKFLAAFDEVYQVPDKDGGGGGGGSNPFKDNIFNKPSFTKENKSAIDTASKQLDDLINKLKIIPNPFDIDIRPNIKPTGEAVVTEFNKVKQEVPKAFKSIIPPIIPVWGQIIKDSKKTSDATVSNFRGILPSILPTWNAIAQGSKVSADKSASAYQGLLPRVLPTWNAIAQGSKVSADKAASAYQGLLPKVLPTWQQITNGANATSQANEKAAKNTESSWRNSMEGLKKEAPSFLQNLQNAFSGAKLTLAIGLTAIVATGSLLWKILNASSGFKLPLTSLGTGVAGAAAMPTKTTTSAKKTTAAKPTVPSFSVIPKFHSGGIFKAPTPGGEGLALLKDGERVTNGNGGDIILQVGTLVADERGLRELERKLRSIRIGENIRTGGAFA